jgi:hypothetical protein
MECTIFGLTICHTVACHQHSLTQVKNFTGSNMVLLTSLLVDNPAHLLSPTPLTSSQRFRFVLLATRISDKNGTLDYADWIREFVEDMRATQAALSAARPGTGSGGARLLRFQCLMTDNCKPLRSGLCRGLNGMTCVESSVALLPLSQ